MFISESESFPRRLYSVLPLTGFWQVSTGFRYENWPITQFAVPNRNFSCGCSTVQKIRSPDDEWELQIYSSICILIRVGAANFRKAVHVVRHSSDRSTSESMSAGTSNSSRRFENEMCLRRFGRIAWFLFFRILYNGRVQYYTRRWKVIHKQLKIRSWTDCLSITSETRTHSFHKDA